MQTLIIDNLEWTQIGAQHWILDYQLHLDKLIEGPMDEWDEYEIAQCQSKLSYYQYLYNQF
jgi:hypothetical protein